MPTRALPAAAQVDLQRILSDTERGLAAADQLPELEYDDTTAHIPGYIGLINRRAQEQLRLALVAAAAIVEVIGALTWPAATRRRAVDYWHEQIRQLCTIDRVRFLAARRQQPSWDQFQQRLQQPDVVPRAVPKRRLDVPSFGQQLTHAMEHSRVGVNWMVTETARLRQPVAKSTIERLMEDKQRPRIETVRALEAALTTAQHDVPFHFQRPATRRR